MEPTETALGQLDTGPMASWYIMARTVMKSGAGPNTAFPEVRARVKKNLAKEVGFYLSSFGKGSGEGRALGEQTASAGKALKCQKGWNVPEAQRKPIELGRWVGSRCLCEDIWTWASGERRAMRFLSQASLICALCQSVSAAFWFSDHDLAYLLTCYVWAIPHSLGLWASS